MGSSVRSSVGYISQLITCFLTSAMPSYVWCEEIPNFYVVKFVNLFMTSEFYVTLRKVHLKLFLLILP